MHEARFRGLATPCPPADLTAVVWGTYDLSKPRTRICLEGLRTSFGRTIEIHADVWSGIEDKSQVRGWPRRLGILARWLAAYPLLICRYLAAPKHDAVVILYMGHIDVLMIRPWAWLRRVPVVWDVMLTMHETLVEDRRLIRSGGLASWLVDRWDRLALSAADRAILLTGTRRDQLARRLTLPPERMEVVPLAAETAAFPPVAPRPAAQPERLRILFYAQFTPMHGLDRVIAAARLAADLPFDWRFIGTGQEGWRLREWIERERPANVSWQDWVAYEELIDEIAGADVCLGLFGDSPKAESVVPNKALQVLAAGRGLVTRDTAAMREELRGEEAGVYLVEGGEPAGIVSALQQAWSERDMLRRGPLHAGLRDRLTPEKTARSFAELVAAVAAGRRTGGGRSGTANVLAAGRGGNAADTRRG